MYQEARLKGQGSAVAVGRVRKVAREQEIGINSIMMCAVAARESKEQKAHPIPTPARTRGLAKIVITEQRTSTALDKHQALRRG